MGCVCERVEGSLCVCVCSRLCVHAHALTRARKQTRTHSYTVPHARALSFSSAHKRMYWHVRVNVNTTPDVHIMTDRYYLMTPIKFTGGMRKCHKCVEKCVEGSRVYSVESVAKFSIIHRDARR